MRKRPIGMIVALVVAIQLFAPIPQAAAQSKLDKPAGGSISGVVTVEGKPAKDVGVILMRFEAGPFDATAVGRARTDKDGKFVFEDIGQGNFGLDAYAPGYFSFDDSPREGAVAITLGEGETVKNVAIALEKGGAITGKLTDEDGNPIASQSIQVYAKQPNGQFDLAQVWERTVSSDDRGIYRVFGLAPGTYAIAAGSSETERSLNRGLGVHYERRYYGESPSSEGARKIELAIGGEAQGVDIVLKRMADGYMIRGRVIQSGTKQPVPSAFVRYEFERAGGFGGSSGVSASEAGEFSIQNVATGTYAIKAVVRSSNEGSFTSDAVEVNVVDRDLNDVVIEMKPAATLKGFIAPLETEAGLDLSSFGDRSLALIGIVEPSSPSAGSREVPTVMLRVRPDRSFVAVGVKPGHYRVSMWPWAPVKGFFVARVEIDGAAVAGPVDVEGTETIANVRIVIGRAGGVIRGRIVGRNGEIVYSRVDVTAGAEGNGTLQMVQRIDSSGEFLIEGIPPGETEVKATYYPPSGKPEVSGSKRVSVPAEGKVDVTIELDLEADPAPKGGGL